MRLRKQDAWGSGAFNAPRGFKKHRGVDVMCPAGGDVKSQFVGRVTKIGYPYDQGVSRDTQHALKKALRYVEITDSNGLSYRYFYISPSCSAGDYIRVDELIGVAQDLKQIYAEITDHYHFEVKDTDGKYLDPNDYIVFR